MGSLALGEEDEATYRQWPRLVPSPSPLHQHRCRPALETVINGTTWYHSPPSPRRFASELQAPITSPARYNFVSPVNFDGPEYGHPSLQRQPYHAYFNDNAFEPGGMRPSAHVVPPSMAFNCVPDYGHGSRYGSVIPGHPYHGMNSMCVSSAGYPFNAQQNQRVPYFQYDLHVSPYIPPANAVCVPYPDPGISERSPPPSGPIMLECASYGMPPHALRTAGKTFKQIVTWSGMTMPVTVTSQAAAMVEWIQRQAGDLFGFDLEWKPNRCKDEDNAVALLQICGPTDCLVIQLLYTDTIPQVLHQFLHNAKKQLGGVGILQDVAKLEKDHDLVCQGQVELGALASEKLQRNELRRTGLKMLVHQVLGMTLVKLKKITLSNWEKENLDDKQIEYACIDAWAAYAVLHRLMTL